MKMTSIFLCLLFVATTTMPKLPAMEAQNPDLHKSWLARPGMIMLCKTQHNKFFNAQDLHPLHIAAMLGDIALVDLYLKKSIDPCLPDNRGYTPLHLAAMANEPKMIRFLIEWLCTHGRAADINVSAHIDGFTALHLAIVLQNIEAINELLPLANSHTPHASTHFRSNEMNRSVYIDMQLNNQPKSKCVMGLGSGVGNCTIL